MGTYVVVVTDSAGRVVEALRREDGCELDAVAAHALEVAWNTDPVNSNQAQAIEVWTYEP